MNGLKQFIVKELRTRKKEYFKFGLSQKEINDISKQICGDGIKKYYNKNTN